MFVLFDSTRSGGRLKKKDEEKNIFITADDASNPQNNIVKLLYFSKTAMEVYIVG